MKVYIVYLSGQHRIVKGYYSSQKKAIERIESLKEHYRSVNEIRPISFSFYYVCREMDKDISEFC